MALVLGGRRVLRKINSAARRHPLPFSIVITGLKAAAADLMIQTFVEGTKQVDWRRNSVFLCFGCTYQGCVQYFMYAKLYEGLWCVAPSVDARFVADTECSQAWPKHSKCGD